MSNDEGGGSGDHTDRSGGGKGALSRQLVALAHRGERGRGNAVHGRIIRCLRAESGWVVKEMLPSITKAHVATDAVKLSGNLVLTSRRNLRHAAGTVMGALLMLEWQEFDPTSYMNLDGSGDLSGLIRRRKIQTRTVNGRMVETRLGKRIAEVRKTTTMTSSSSTLLAIKMREMIRTLMIESVKS